MSEETNELKFIDSMALNGPIEDMMKQAIKQNHTQRGLSGELEFEWIYGDSHYNIHLTKDEFLQLKRCLNQSVSYQAHQETNDLDIRCELQHRGKSVTSNIRATVSGMSQIKQYCIQDNFDDLEPTFLKKLRFKGPKNSKDDYSVASSGLYPMRSTLKVEYDLHHVNSRINRTTPPSAQSVESSKEVTLFLQNWGSKNKHFRFKKRFSYTTTNQLWRIDLTAIKSSDNNQYAKTFKESGILQKKETFELEIEYIGSQTRNKYQPIEYPINQFAEIIHGNVYGLDEPSFKPMEDGSYNPFAMTGTVYTGEIPESNTESTTELAFTPSSPRYTDGIEFDEPLDLQESPRQDLPSGVLIKEDYWKESDQLDLRKQLGEGTHILIPRSNDLVSSQYKMEIFPPVLLKDHPIHYIYIPYEYVIDPVPSSLPEEDSDGYTPPSPTARPESTARPEPTFYGGSNLTSENYKPKVVEAVLKDLNSHIHFCYSCIQDTELYLDSLEQEEIIRQYIDVTDLTGNYHKDGWSFVGPQPVSMSTTHLNPLHPYSITHGYAVTEKADGIRAQLLIGKDKLGYLLTPKKQVIATGAKFHEADGQWIFDGEYITQNKSGERIKLFMIFDVYYSSEFSTQPYTYPWAKHKKSKGTSRSEIIHEFQKKHKQGGITYNQFNEQSNIRIGFKQYLEGPEVLKQKKDGSFSNVMNIFKSNKRILSEDTGGFEYATDGLIFLPMYLPVKGMEEGDIVKSIRGTWSLNYKWKPPEENTIDFKVIFSRVKGKADIHSYSYVSEEGIQETRFYQKVQLAVQYKEMDDPSLDFNWLQMTDKQPNKKSFQFFDPPTYSKDNLHVTNIPLTRNQMKCLKDGRQITNGSIVEMRYDPEAPHDFKWVPLRIRDDKTRPQYFTVANNIWNTINDPVTVGMIQGSLDFKALPAPESDDKYYVDTKFAEDTPIRSLHNYIKSKLISRVGSSSDMRRSITIADLSCGRGGDIKKYLSIRTKVDFLLNLDISDNINEAAQRYHSVKQPKPPAVFLQYDTSLSIEKREGCKDESKREICETMLDMIEGKSRTYPKEYRYIKSKYDRIASKGYDIVSSQFSLHYYFKNEATLRGFCENVKYLCADKGYFIGTCYDGLKLVKTMDAMQTDILDMTDDFGSLIYQIKKKYDITDFTYDPENVETMYGQEIDVFMASIGQTLTEYLVNFEFFIQLMKEYGFELALPKYKKGEYNPIKDPIQSFDQIIQNLSEVKERDFNFVKKTYNRDMFDITKDPRYRLLSGLNNWFVFQKV